MVRGYLEAYMLYEYREIVACNNSTARSASNVIHIGRQKRHRNKPCFTMSRDDGTKGVLYQCDVDVSCLSEDRPACYLYRGLCQGFPIPEAIRTIKRAKIRILTRAL